MGPIYIETPYITMYIETPYINSYLDSIYIETSYTYREYAQNK